MVTITDLHLSKFAITLDGVFTIQECYDLIDLSERSCGYKTALVGDAQMVNLGYRNSQRWMNFDKDLANSFFEKLKAYIPAEFQGKRVSGLNERLSFLKYSPGEYFKPHYDGQYVRPDNSEASYITVQAYLNDVEDGGETTFLKKPKYGINEECKVFPKAGRVLLFEQEDLKHEGSILNSGVKYCIRTDVMYYLNCDI